MQLRTAIKIRSPVKDMVKRPPDFLSPQETFEHYEHRSPQSSNAQSMNSLHQVQVTRPVSSNGDFGQLACEYRAAPPGVLKHPRPESQSFSTKITSYLPDKKRPPLKYIISVAICVPIFLIIVLFGAVWLQELGIL